jgi:uncharacterized caspase-like protein
MPMNPFAAGLEPLPHALLRGARAQGLAAWLFWVICLVCLVCLAYLLHAPAMAAGPAPAAEKRMALVIGNARYPAIPLNNPENDARVVASTLRRLGFDVQEHVNLPVKRFRQVLRDYVRRLQNESGVGLLYYAGHGVQIDGKNYLLPVDINLRDEEEIKDEAVDIDDLFMSKLARAKTKGLIVVLDACRDNPFRGKTRNVQAAGGLAEMGAPGAYIAYSAAPGATAEDGPENTNSVFTRHLAYEMLQPGQEIETTFKNVRVKVLRDTQKRQLPWTNSSLTIDFQFNAQAAGAAAAKAEAERQARIKALQDMLDKREADQRQLEAQLEAMQRQLALQQQATAAAPATTTSAAAPDATPGTALPAPSPVEGPAPSLPQPAPARPPLPTPMPMPSATASPAPSATAAPTTLPTPSPTTLPTPVPTRLPTPSPPSATTKPEGNAVPSEPRREPPPAAAGQAQSRPGPATTRPATTAAGRRANTERCVELQVRASLGEPVSLADIQRECRP